ncbi:hypothetical protein IV203_012948 [Nitzschia inconspicua]|uniref:Uncharacterized protein n=1 Tax=Nitzschia inconspicua TaxID=303405 RepID=A0A9K3M451_9STRA|nr:hypothetical protein IV203_012948 [Nitzschia inconspicua]
MAENSQLSAALRLNNEAVSLLVAGQECKALLHLQQAVGIVKRSIARHLQRGASTILRKPVVSNPESHKHELTLEQLHQDSVQLAGLNNLQCFVFNRAFRVTSDQLPSSPIEKAAQTGSAIIIFNMALVLHRACLLQNRTVPASKALALYKIVLHLIKSSSASPASSSVQDIGRAIQVAALNNMAQLRFEEGQYAQASRDFGSLANLMTTIQQAPLGATEMQGIVINILCLKKGAKFAPAA